MYRIVPSFFIQKSTSEIYKERYSTPVIIEVQNALCDVVGLRADFWMCILSSRSPRSTDNDIAQCMIDSIEFKMNICFLINKITSMLNV